MTDCGRALDLNRYHYGAWLGAWAICYLHGRRCRSLAAPCAPRLKLPSTTTAARKSLERCEEFLHSRPAPTSPRDGASCCEWDAAPNPKFQTGRLSSKFTSSHWPFGVVGHVIRGYPLPPVF